MDYERVLLVKAEVFVYKIPPRQSNRGYRAADWGLDSPFWVGRMRLVTVGNDLIIKLEDRNTGDLFAKCPIEAFPGIAVESVLDSSRYFVIRLKSDVGRTMFTGMGFAERSDSFDFNVSIQDHFKCLKHEQDDEAYMAQEEAGTTPSLDLAFKEGQRIKLNLNTRRPGDESATNSCKSKAILTGQQLPTGVGLLPPPPAPSFSRNRGNRTTGGLATGNSNGAAAMSSSVAAASSPPNLDDVFSLSNPSVIPASAAPNSSVDLLSGLWDPS